MRKPLVLLVLAAGFAPAPRVAAEPGVTKMALVTIEAAAAASVAPARVWAVLTDVSLAKRWCPYWSAEPGKGTLAAIGATLAFRDEYGNAGRSVVLYCDDGKELRVAHVPDDGSYLCQTTFRLAGSGSGTRITVIEQYSDGMDVPLDRDTAAAARKSVESYLAALAALAATEPAR